MLWTRHGLLLKGTKVLLALCQMTHAGKIPWKKIQIPKGDTGKGVSATLNLVNTDFPWRLNLDISSSMKFSLNARLGIPDCPAHISFPGLNYPARRKWACANSSTTRWAPWALHPWDLTWSLAVAGALECCVCSYAHVRAQACLWVCVVTWKVTYFCSVTSFTPPVFSNVT